jgi:hypothetical protein
MLYMEWPLVSPINRPTALIRLLGTCYLDGCQWLCFSLRRPASAVTAVYVTFGFSVTAEKRES